MRFSPSSQARRAVPAGTRAAKRSGWDPRLERENSSNVERSEICELPCSAGHGGLIIHHARHTFISHALPGGRTLAEVRDAAGHSSVLVTSAYLHVAVEDTGAVGDLFRVR